MPRAGIETSTWPSGCPASLVTPPEIVTGCCAASRDGNQARPVHVRNRRMECNMHPPALTERWRSTGAHAGTGMETPGAVSRQDALLSIALCIQLRARRPTAGRANTRVDGRRQGRRGAAPGPRHRARFDITRAEMAREGVWFLEVLALRPLFLRTNRRRPESDAASSTPAKAERLHTEAGKLSPCGRHA